MGATILVADDEVFITDLLSELLQEEGYQVLRAYDGTQALATIERACPDVVLTDHMMPGRSGLELVRYLHDHPACAAPVILMSAAQPVPLPPETHFLAKPFDLNAVPDLVAQVLPDQRR
jgi:two-component system, sensor histidine kinase and response regulator